MRAFLHRTWQSVRGIFHKYPLLIIPVVVLLLVLLLCAGFGIYVLSRSWEQIPPPPARPQRLLGVDASGVYLALVIVQAEGEKVYFLDLLSGDRWGEILFEGEFYVERYGKGATDCNLSDLKFAAWKRPFSGVFDCLEIQATQEVGTPPRLTVVLDQDRNLWLYRRTSSDPLIFLLCLGISAGLVVGTALYSQHLRKHLSIEAMKVLARRRQRLGAILLLVVAFIGAVIWLFNRLSKIPRESAGKKEARIQQTAVAGMVMAHIPAGTYVIASEGGKQVNLEAFDMDVYEVTNAQYAQYMNAIAYNTSVTFFLAASHPGARIHKVDKLWQADAGYADHPVVEVNLSGAGNYCRWRDADLPSVEQWEVAARGGLIDQPYPWGEQQPVCTSGAGNGANFNRDGCPGDTLPVGSYAPNGYGLYDMAGNVREWMNHRTAPSESTIAVMGGAWDTVEVYLRVDKMDGFEDGYFNDIGFRCVRLP
jgi:formylglycine-generating enzyme required for sulfatase activity